MKETLDREAVESVFSELEEQHTDMIDTYYSFQNGLMLLKQCIYPSSRYPIAPDCEIPNSVVRGFWKEEHKYEEEEVYVPDYEIGFISSKQYLLPRSSGDAVSEEAETVSSKASKKKNFQKRKSSKYKRTSRLSKNKSGESQNPLFLKACDRLFEEEWFPQDCEYEVNAVIDQLTVCVDKRDPDIHNRSCDYILEFNGIQKLTPTQVAAIGEKLTHQLANESDPSILKDCMQAISGLIFRSDTAIALIKSSLKSDNFDLRKTAKNALRSLGVKQTSMKYTPQDSSSTITKSLTASVSEERLKSSKEMTSEIKKLHPKESKSRTKMRSAKDSASKGKKSKRKIDVSAEKPAPPVEQVIETIVQPEKEPVIETVIEPEKEPVIETIILPEKEPVLEIIDQTEEVEVAEVAKEVMSISPEITAALQEAKDLPADTQVESIKEEKEEITEKIVEIVDEKQILELPTEEMFKESEVLFDVDEIIQQPEDDKEILKEDTLLEIPAEKEEKDSDLDSKLISDEKPFELPEDISEQTESIEIIETEFKTDQELERTPEPVVSVQEEKPIYLPKIMSPIKSHALIDMPERQKAVRTQSAFEKQKQRHERDLQNRERITRLFNVKKDNYFLTKDSNKTVSAKRVMNTKAPAAVATVDKLRASLFPYSKGGKGYDSFVKELHSIDKIPRKTTMKIQQTKSMLEPVNNITNTEYQANMQVKMEFVEALSFPVRATAGTAISPTAGLPPAFAAATHSTAAVPPATALPFGAPGIAIPPFTAAGAATTLLPGTAIPLAAAVPLPGAASPDGAFFTKYQDIYPGSRAKEYPGIKSEVPFDYHTSSWINDVLNGDNRDQVPAKDEQQKLSRNRYGEKKIDPSKEWARKFTEREYGLPDDTGTTFVIPRKEIVDPEKKMDSSKEWAQKFPSEQQERRWPEDADWNKKRELRQKDMLDKKEFGMAKRWTQKTDYSSIHKVLPDPTNRNLPVMMGPKQEQRWSESDDWSKKRNYRDKTISEEEKYLIKNWAHDLPWSNINKTCSNTIDHHLVEIKEAEQERSAGSRLYQKTLTNITPANMEWSDKAFYPVDKLSPWMSYHLQYKPERIEEEIDVPSFELKNVSQTAPEWLPKYRRMMFSPDFYLQREKWLSDYRRPTSIIY